MKDGWLLYMAHQKGFKKCWLSKDDPTRTFAVAVTEEVPTTIVLSLENNRKLQRKARHRGVCEFTLRP